MIALWELRSFGLYGNKNLEKPEQRAGNERFDKGS